MTEPAPAAGRGQSLTAAALLLAGATVLSRVLGYAREAVLAWQVGVGPETDAFRAAFQIPDLLNYFLAGGALSIAFVPMVAARLAERGEEAARTLLATVLGTTTCVAVAATAVLFWQADALIALQFPRFDPETRELTTRLTRIVLPAQIAFVSGGIIRAGLMARRRFGAQAAAPLLYNTGIIAGGLLLAPALGVEGFAWGALAGAVAGPLLVGLVALGRAGGLGFRVAFRDRDFLHYLRTAAPLMLGLSLLTVDEWYDRYFGALQQAGTVARLGFARMLMQVPVAVVGQALATAALPILAGLHRSGRRAELERVLGTTLAAGLGLGVLTAAACVALAEPLVALLYQRGAFGEADALAVARLLRVFALAVPGWIAQQIAVRAFYARGDTWRPMLLGTGFALAAIPLYLALGSRYGGAGLAASGAIAISANALATLLLARRLHGAPRVAPLATGLVRAALAAAPAVFAARAVLGTPRGGGAAAGLDLLAGGVVFGAVVLPLVWWVGGAELREGLRRLLVRRP